jgi:glycosyltransferase involved in cell wall biosynthesis
MLKVGFGLGFLAKGLQKNHVDGIGVYSRELYHALLPQPIELLPYVYGQNDAITFAKTNPLHSSFIKHVIESQFFKKKIECVSEGFKPDIIHAPDHLIPRVKNIPVIATVMDLIPFIHPEWTRGRFRNIKNHLFKNTILGADHIITISEYSKNDLMKYFNIPEEKISVTYLGVNPEFYQPFSDEDKNKVLKKLKLEPGFFLFVGTLQRRKNLEAALDAHALLSNQDRKLHPLVIVGNAGWASQELLGQIEKDEQEGFVRWLKYLPNHEVKCLLQSALSLVYVSLYEGFGLPILEAFASGTPVITSNVSSIPEVAGDAAIMVCPNDIDEIQASMQRLIASKDARESLIAQGLIKAQEFSWENCAKSTIKAYQKLLKA